MKKYTCYSIKQFQFLVSKGNTPVEIITHYKTGRNGFVFLRTKRFDSALKEYNKQF